MRFPVLPALLFLLVCIAADRTIYREIVCRWGRGRASMAYEIVAILLTLLYGMIVCLPKRNGSDGMLLFVMWGLFVYLTIYVPKIIFLVFQLLSCIPRLFGHRRLRVMDIVGGAAAVFTFVALWWGALINRTKFETRTVTVEVAGLPSDFEGFRIAQISDLHLGTYAGDTKFVSEVVDEVNRLSPDVIVFTGDLVNRRSREAAPFVPTLSGLKARYGVYSVLGNHDYGDYNDWPDDKARESDVRRLYGLMDEMGWQTLENSTRWIHRGDDSIAIVGVGNISRPPFRVYGNLAKAYPDPADSNFKILLSHNPDHWTDDIMDRPDVNMQLTLSGHTHAMQVEVFGLSPASFKYENWGSLSADTLGKKLYVNKGLGTEGVPFRIGARPEITLLILKAERQ